MVAVLRLLNLMIFYYNDPMITIYVHMMDTNGEKQKMIIVKIILIYVN